MVGVGRRFIAPSIRRRPFGALKLRPTTTPNHTLQLTCACTILLIPAKCCGTGVFTGTGITVTETAKRLGVTRVALSRVLNGKAGISADMAVRLAAALGGSAESWLHMQANYDLWRAERSLKRTVAKIEPLKRAA